MRVRKWWQRHSHCHTRRSLSIFLRIIISDVRFAIFSGSAILTCSLPLERWTVIKQVSLHVQCTVHQTPFSGDVIGHLLSLPHFTRNNMRCKYHNTTPFQLRNYLNLSCPLLVTVILRTKTNTYIPPYVIWGLLPITSVLGAYDKHRYIYLTYTNTLSCEKSRDKLCGLAVAFALYTQNAKVCVRKRYLFMIFNSVE